MEDALQFKEIFGFKDHMPGTAITDGGDILLFVDEEVAFIIAPEMARKLGERLIELAAMEATQEAK